MSCQQKKQDDINEIKETNSNDNFLKDSKTKNNKFKMYEMSEMALLMEQMYIENQRLKTKIIDNDSLGLFPEYYSSMNTAELTNQKDKDGFFEVQTNLFLAAQKEIYKNPSNAKANFNYMVGKCIECHQVKCLGPISKIKKLLIQ